LIPLGEGYASATGTATTSHIEQGRLPAFLATAKAAPDVIVSSSDERLLRLEPDGAATKVTQPANAQGLPALAAHDFLP
jgi:hypothetical protein